MDVGQTVADRDVVGGVDTHKDLHVAAVVDEFDRVLGSRCFATTRHGYKQMLTWMRSFGQLRRVGVEATGTYGAGLLRYMQNAGVEVLEVTAPVWMPRMPRTQPSRAAVPSRPKSRDGMVESLRVLKACRKTAVAARRVALQMIHNTIVRAPDDLRETLRKMTRMQLIRTLAAWRNPSSSGGPFFTLAKKPARPLAATLRGSTIPSGAIPLSTSQARRCSKIRSPNDPMPLY
jgi:transposase